jgi:integrase
MSGIAALRAKRSANTARDLPPARASWSTIQRRATSTWISRLRQAKLRGVRLYDLRHTFATELLA